MASFRSLLFNGVLRITAKRYARRMEVDPVAITKVRQAMENMGERMLKSYSGARFEEAELGDVPVIWSHSGQSDLARVRSDNSGVIYYCHGGGYILASPRVYRRFTGQLSQATACQVVAPDYRLAPEHPFPAAPEDALSGYKALLKQGIDPSRITIMGDSAGGNLALVTLLNIKASGLPQPNSGVLLSPWADLTGSGYSYLVNARQDPMLPADRITEAARAYAPEGDLADWKISPLFGDFEGLPPLLIHAGSTEILRDDACRSALAAQAAGVHSELKLWYRMPHVFQIFSQILPEARQAIREIAQFVEARRLEALKR